MFKSGWDHTGEVNGVGMGAEATDKDISSARLHGEQDALRAVASGDSGISNLPVLAMAD